MARLFDLARLVVARRGLPALLVLLLASCVQQETQGRRPAGRQDQILAQPTTILGASTPILPSPTILYTAQSPNSIQADSTKTVTNTPFARPASTQTATAAATASATLNPYTGLSIEELSNRDYGGGNLEIVETMESGEVFTRYLITYPSDGLSIYGFMNVPNEGTRFPVAIVLHGYIPPSDYETVSYTERYANALAEAGYFVIHPNFRNYPPSDSGPDPYRIGFATDILNLIAIIREQSLDPSGYLRRADADDINLFGHSMGGGIALADGRALCRHERGRSLEL